MGKNRKKKASRQNQSAPSYTVEKFDDLKTSAITTLKGILVKIQVKE